MKIESSAMNRRPPNDEDEDGPIDTPIDDATLGQQTLQQGASHEENGLAEGEAKTPDGFAPGFAPGDGGRARISSRSSVARSAGIVSMAVMASRVLGLVREMVFAFFFGASKSYAIDAYFIAFRIPNLLRDLFAEGALSSAFVTVFSDYLVTKGEKAAFRLSNLIATALMLILGILVVLGIIFAHTVVAIIAPGYESEPQKFELTVRLTRIMMPFILLIAMAAKAMGILNARDRFGVPALASSFFNLGSIVGGLAFALFLVDPTFAHPVSSIVDRPTEAIFGMAYGVLIGGFLQFAVQWPSLRRAGFRYRPMLSFSDPGVRRILNLMGPAVIGAAAVQVNVLINSNFASKIPGDGPVAWLSYAFRLMQFPIGVFGVAIATATLPSISRSAALEELGTFKRTLASSIRLAFLLTVPSAVGLAVLSRPIIALIYQRGPFQSVDTDHTAGALAFYSIGLAGYAAIRILAPAFYALNDARTPMMISLLSIVINFVMNSILVGPLRERGLALSTSTVALMNFGLLYLIMRRRVDGIEGKRTAILLSKILAASGVMGIVCWVATEAIVRAAGLSFAARMVNVAASVSLGAVVFYFAASILGVEELKTATDTFANRISRIRRR
jgi:putative peptidoglycan lipid II flippase